MKTQKSGCSKILVCFIVIIVLFIALVVVLANTLGKDLPRDDAEKSSNKELQAIMDATGMTLENATEAHEAFVKISDGISVIYSVTYDELLDDITVDGSKGYRIKTEFSNDVILTTLNGELYSIRYLGYDYYINDTVNGYFYDRNGKFIAEPNYD